MSTPWKIFAALFLALGLVAAGFGIKSHYNTAALAQAAKDDQAGSKAYTQGAADGITAQDQAVKVDQDKQLLTGDDAAVDRDRAVLVRLTPKRLPADPKAPEPGPVGPPIESPAEVAKDRLIEDLTKAYADSKTALVDTQALLATKTSEADNYHQSADAYKREVDGLHVVVAALQSQDRPWSVGVIYGSNGTAGASVERDAGPFRVGVDVVRRSLSNGNSTLEAAATAAWRF